MFTKHNLFFHKKLQPLKTNLFSRYHHSKEPRNSSGVNIIFIGAIISSLCIIFHDPPPGDY